MDKKSKEKLLIEIADIYYTTADAIDLIFKRNKVDVFKFYELIMSENLPYKRDQFYSMFKNEGTADHLWTGLFESKNFKW